MREKKFEIIMNDKHTCVRKNSLTKSIVDKDGSQLPERQCRFQDSRSGCTSDHHPAYVLWQSNKQQLTIIHSIRVFHLSVLNKKWKLVMDA